MAEEMRYMNVPPRNIRRRRLLILIPVVVLLLFLYVIGYRATALRREVTKYTDATTAISSQSNFLGKQFRAALNSGSKSKYLSESLDNIVDQSLGLSQRAEAIEPPKDLKLAHSFFIVAIKLRHQGLEKYNRFVINSMSSVKASSNNQVSKEAIEDIRLSDKAYRYFVDETRRYLKSNNLTIKLKESVFLTSKTKQLNISTKSKTKSDVLGAPDIFVEDVATVPLRVSYNPDNDIRVLPDTGDVAVRIEAGNKGKVDEKDIAVEVSLYNDNKLITKKSGIIDSIKQGETSKITIEGFEAIKDGINIFKIQLGPLLTEKNTQDNKYEYKFIIQKLDTTNETSNSN